MENNNFKFKIYSKNNHGCKCGYMLILESSNSVRCSRHRGSQRITRYFFSVCFKVSLKQWLQYQNSSLCSTVVYTKACTLTWGDPILYQAEGSKLGKKTICELKTCTSWLSCDWQNPFQAFFWWETVLCTFVLWNWTHFFCMSLKFNGTKATRSSTNDLLSVIKDMHICQDEWGFCGGTDVSD